MMQVVEIFSYGKITNPLLYIHSMSAGDLVTYHINFFFRNILASTANG